MLIGCLVMTSMNPLGAVSVTMVPAPTSAIFHICLPVMQAPTVMRRLEVKMGRASVRIVSLVSVVVFILHIFACIFHYVALWNDRNTSWVEASGIVDRNSQIDRCRLHFQLKMLFLLLARVLRQDSTCLCSSLDRHVCDARNSLHACS
jgi:hypothetical protein